ncbi:MAG: UDP-N-acetylmuramoyl-L-alanine--D-glutamate ligase, partial [Patescibacteria group bacterium]|nr:UDP-N-acetylmuramoyl-L-alanine--D-glutamate ligase [Patescibacteria group bacterium]
IWDNLSNFDIVFRSPGISLNHPKLKEARDSGVIISSQIKLFFKLCPATIIGVTGTKGKGTTSSLIYEIVKKNLKFLISNLKSNPNDQMTNGKINDKWEMKNDKLSQVYLAGNIGYPAITLIPKLKSDDIVILELSSFQLMDMDKSPHIAIVTNLSVDHLDYHEDEDEYQFAKINILKFQDNDDYAVLNSDSTFGLDILNREVKSKIKYFSHTENKDATVKNDQVILDPKNRSITICDKKDIKLFGRHNLENIAAASIVADILGITPKVTSEVASQFKGLPHRLELVQEINGVKYINDSYATNPEPTIAAINSFPENKILILGGSSKGANFDDLSQIISKSNVSTVSLIGVEGQKIKNSLLKNGFKGKIISGGDSINEIVSNAKRLAKPGDVVIFSPACASFDMFKNYKDRGEKFKTEVLNLISKS